MKFSPVFYQECGLISPFLSQKTVIHVALSTPHALIFLQDFLISFLEKNPTGISTLSSLPIDTEEQDNYELCYPIKIEKSTHGIIFIGQKADESPYTKEEVEELKKTCEAIQVCFINILLQSNYKEENDMMKKMIQEKTKKLSSQNFEIKNMLRQQSDFIAVTAHEFRTPLNIALLQLEDTLDSYSHSRQVLEDMDILGSSLEKLKSLTQHLFDVQQFDLERITLKQEVLPAKEFFENIFLDSKELFKQQQITLKFECSVPEKVYILADKVKIQQVTNNLLSNALKFTPSGGEVVISIQYHEEDRKVVFSVSDTGPGVPDDAKKRIFEKFQSTKATMGMGLGMGLYICKKIVELHQGEIYVEDNSPTGARFILNLPAHSA